MGRAWSALLLPSHLVEHDAGGHRDVERVDVAAGGDGDEVVAELLSHLGDSLALAAHHEDGTLGEGRFKERLPTKGCPVDPEPRFLEVLDLPIEVHHPGGGDVVGGPA